MKTPFYVMIILIGFAAASCSETKTPGGLKYTVLRKGDGKPMTVGDVLVLNMQLKDHKDSVWFSSKENGSPVMLPVPDASMEKDDGEYGVFKILTKGDSVMFQVPVKTFFTKTRKRPIPRGIDSTGFFVFNVGLTESMTQAQAEEKQQKMMRDMQLAQVKKDSLLINNYITEKGMTAQSTASGLRYVVRKDGKGNMAAAGQTASVKYAGFTLDGKIFDTNIASVAKENNFDNQGADQPYPVVVNTARVIAGWDEMLMMMNKGMKVTVIIPSYLAYGPQSRGPGIPANSILMFDMEVTDIK